jgi:hypothetical protein
MSGPIATRCIGKEASGICCLTLPVIANTKSIEKRPRDPEEQGGMMKRHWQRLALIGLIGWAFTSLTDSRSAAQDNDVGGLEIVNLSGQLEAIVGNQLKMVGKDKTANLVLIGDDTTFIYTGTADPSVLAPGLMVRFTADFDQAGTPQAPLAELEIFRPLQGRRLSLEVRQSQTPGVYPVDVQAQAGAAPKNAKAKVAPGDKPAQRNKAQAADPTANNAATAAIQTFQVVGMLRAIQGDRLQVFARNQPLILQASPELKITVSAGDPTFCLPGDEVKLNALKHPNGLIQADTIQVTAAKPLGAIDATALARNKRGKSGDQATKPNDTAAAKQSVGKRPNAK